MSNSTIDRLKQLYLSGHRQKEDCTCGPSSLSMIADALGIGSFSELDWIPVSRKKWILGVDELRERGMAIHEVALAAELQFADKVDLSLRRAFPENFQIFLKDLSRFKACSDYALVLNFPQDLILKRPFGTDQGSPHFSPVGDYDEESGKVTVLDVDCEISESYAISAEELFEGMALLNPAFEIPRGWLLVRRRNRQ